MKNICLAFILLFCISSIKAQNTDSFQYNLMPWPMEITKGTSKFIINTDFTIALAGNYNKRLYDASTRFLRRLTNKTGTFINEGFAFDNKEINNPSLLISVDKIGKLEINEDESYHLTISNKRILITAPTDLGALKGLETLLQLVNHNRTNYFFPEVAIHDSPRFTWRGLMIDVARHFQPMEVLKRNLDAMAAVKMNVFHWHLTDDQGFRIESKTHPKLHELGSDGQYYTHEQVKEVVQYASDRGIRVIPEFDVPGHATAILTAYPELGSLPLSETGQNPYKIERYAGIFDPTLDPTNEKTYQILSDLFGEISPLFPDKYIHIGGDENEGKHWDSNKNIQAFKKKYGLKTNHDLQTYFNIKLQKILEGYGKSLMGWEEIMTPNMPKTALIHSWRGINEGVPAGQSLAVAAKNGYQAILSNGYYIDLMYSVDDHYLVDPEPEGYKLTAKEKERILGGEATMWSELVTPLTIDSRIWPRTAAIAERFWSQKDITDIDDMYKRLEVISFQLEALGLTHIKNRNLILRNISNNQNIEALITLTKVYEPLKKYSRNKGGTEYKSFSPFTLFADACTADAYEARKFNKLVDSYIKAPTDSTRNQIIDFLEKWEQNLQEFSKLKLNPILNSLIPVSKNLSDLSRSLLKNMQQQKPEDKNLDLLEKTISRVKKPIGNIDVELAILKSSERLLESFKTR